MPARPVQSRGLRARRALGAALAMLPFGVVLLLPVLTGPPPPVLPTHWGLDGVDGFSTGAGFLGAVTGLAGFCAVLAALSSLLWALVPDYVSRWLVTAAAAVGAGAAGAYLLTLVGLRTAGGDPEQVGAGWPVASMLLAAGWGWVAYLAHGRGRVDRQAVVESVPERDRVVPLPQGPAPEWETSVGSGLLTGTAVFVAAVSVVVTVLMGWSGGWFAALALGVPVLGLAGYVLAWSRVRVRVDAAGLTLVSERWPVRLRHIGAREVVGVSSAEIDPMRWGGYGLRAVPGRTAYVVSGGAGVVVYRDCGSLFAVEVTQGQLVADAGAEALRSAAGRALAARGGARG